MKQEFSESLLIVEEKTNSLIDTKISIVKNDISHAILIVADEANKAITSTNSKVDGVIKSVNSTNSKVDGVIESVNSTNSKVDRVIEGVNSTNYKVYEVIESVNSTNSKVEEHNIQENAYQTFIGTGEYAQEGNYKYTAEIKIINKRLHTFGENKRWMESVDDASVAYKDSLIEILKVRKDNWGTEPQGKTSTICGFIPYSSSNQNDNNNLHMLYRKFEWNTSIELSIKVNRIYDNSLTTSVYKYYMLYDYLSELIKINWKKSLEVC